VWALMCFCLFGCVHVHVEGEERFMNRLNSCAPTTQIPTLRLMDLHVVETEDNELRSPFLFNSYDLN
jgi:hypothetical protein